MVAMENDNNSLPTLQELETLSSIELKRLYQRLFLASAPRSASISFLKGILAWEIQALAQGKDPARLRQQLIKSSGNIAPTNAARYKPGTRLIREWQGKTYEVSILDEGYQFQGQRYRSLSSIARQITGAHWSGPRFFGITS